jgi:N-acetylmuramoyl-L-alanine amidase
MRRADGLFEGLQRYFQNNPPFNSYLAWQQEQKNRQA